jgi:lipopolysaccharide/colanic/teichoic acid biosynthesis glycosyltransferase
VSDTSKPEPERGLPNPIERALGLAGLVAVAPVLGAAAVAIRATSPGPAIFRQQRVGRHGRPFTLYKLRTMRSDVSGPQFTADGDARITPVGRVLRKTKIDELPELWNVVRGDLSLVGPRPEVSRYIDLSDPRWRRALAARPGLTHPVTLKLRNEEELLSAVQGSSEAYYERTLVPYKLKGYLDYQSRRSWRSDLVIIGQTALVIAFPRLAPPPSQAEVEAEAAALAPA